MRGQQTFDLDGDDLTCYLIAKDHPDPIVIKILRIIHLSIHNN